MTSITRTCDRLARRRRRRDVERENLPPPDHPKDPQRGERIRQHARRVAEAEGREQDVGNGWRLEPDEAGQMCLTT